MPRNYLPAEDCVFRLDSSLGFRQAFPMTFENVGLGDDGFEFDGSSSNIVGIVDDRLDLINGTVEISFNGTGLQENAHVLLSKGYYAALWRNGSYHVSCWSGLLKCVLSNIDLDYQYVSIYTSELYMDSHIMFVFDDNYLKLYHNGVVVDTEIRTLLFPDACIGEPLYIGQVDDNYHFDSTIKHISIYNRALTPQEVADRYNEVTFNVE